MTIRPLVRGVAAARGRVRAASPSELRAGAASISVLALLAAGPALAQSTEEAAARRDVFLLDPISLHGERGDGPVEGYVAGRTRTGAKIDLPIEKIPQSVSVVGADQIEDQAAGSVAEALRYTPGVFTEYRGPSNLHDETFVRGFDYAPRYLDGLAYGLDSLGRIDPFLLERVELLKGPSSVLYGRMTPGGLINMTTKTPTGEAAGHLRLGVGSRDRMEAAADLQGTFETIESLSWRLVGTAWRQDTQEKQGEEQVFALAPSLRWTPDADTSLTLLAIIEREPEAGFRNFREKLGSVTPTDFGYVPWDFQVSDPDFQKSERTQLSAGWKFEHRFAPGLTLRNNARVTHIDSAYRTLTWGSLDATQRNISRTASGGTEDLLQFAVDTQIEAKLETGPVAHTVLGGVDYLYSRRDYEWGFDRTTVPDIDWTNPVYGIGGVNLVPSSDDVTTSTQLGLYAQEVAELGGLVVALGGRYDMAETKVEDRLAGGDRSQDDDAFTGRIGALYRFSNGIAPYASFSTSFDPVTRAAPAGEPAFEPSEGEQYEVGIKWASPEGRFLATASAFHITQTNVLSYDYASSSYFQTGEVESRGLEFELRAQATDRLSLIGALTFLDSEVTASRDASEVGRMPARTPRNLASIWAKYEVGFGLDLGGGLRWIGESYGDASNSFKVDSTALADFEIGYDLGRLSPELEGARAQFNITNLTDERYVASCASAYACFAGEGREMRLALSYEW